MAFAFPASCHAACLGVAFIAAPAPLGLGRPAGPSEVQELSRLTDQLRNGTPFERAWAAEEIGTFGPKGRSALPFLLDAFEDAEPRARLAAAGAVLGIAPSRCREATQVVADFLRERLRETAFVTRPTDALFEDFRAVLRVADAYSPACKAAVPALAIARRWGE